MLWDGVRRNMDFEASEIFWRRHQTTHFRARATAPTSVSSYSLISVPSPEKRENFQRMGAYKGRKIWTHIFLFTLRFMQF